MKRRICFFHLAFLMLYMLCINSKAKAQVFNIMPIHGNVSFSYSQVPENLVSVISYTTGASFQWEESFTPVYGFIDISCATAADYSFSAPLTRTTYFRRKVVTANYIGYSNTVKLELVSSNWENYNYVREHDILIPAMSDWQTIDQLPIGSKLQTTTYLDGLGRPVEKISRETATPADPANIGNLWGDVVQFAKYDAAARQPKDFLPYTSAANSGKFKMDAPIEQPQYYLNTYNETSAFSNSVFDNSPLKKTLNVKQSGTSWAAAAGNSVSYEVNDAADNVQIFTIGYNTGDAPVSLGAYPAGTLYKNRSTDENGKQVIEYINKAGQAILRKVQLDDAPSAAHEGWICTYSVYDDFGLLRYQLQPEAVKWLDDNSWSFAGTDGQTLLNEMCLRYEYDDKGRTILKKAAGSEPLYMLYDQRDRIVFMQDGNQRIKSPAEWTVNLYDGLDRPVLTTLYHTGKTNAALQADIDDALTIHTVTVTNPSNLVTDLIIDHRDPAISAYAAQNSIELIAGFESAANDEFTAYIDPAAITTPVDITVAAYLNPVTEAELNDPAVTTILKYLFYDNYHYGNVKTFNTDFDNGLAYTTGDPVEKSQRTWSLETGSMVRVLTTNTFLTSTSYYDEHGRIIQTIEDNIKSGTDLTTVQYQFDNRVLSTNTKHTTALTGYNNFSIVTKNVFDKIGRISSIEKKYGSNDFKPVAAYSYDDMGRLRSKRLDPGYTGTGKNEMETLAYSYNIHSQITGINKDYALKAPGYSRWDNFFGLYLGYDNRDAAFDHAQLDGHITGTVWNTQGDDAQRKYDYAYDNAGRLTQALFKEKQTPADSWSNANMDFSITGYNGSITYDLNGNLLSMLQKGVVPGNPAPVTVDDLRYAYNNLSNKLAKVTDMGTLGASNGKLGDFKDNSNSGDDYVYDGNGNLILDMNKFVAGASTGENTALGIAGITYNYLDKPEEINIAGKGNIRIVYDADGNKLQRSYTPESTGNTVTTTYINEFVYQGNDLQYINFEEGRVRVMQAVSQENGFDYLTMDGNIDLPGNKRGAFDFYIRDYQSNVRMILTEENHTGSNTCTMERQRSANEEPLFGQVDNNGTPSAANEVKARFAVSSIPGQAGGSGWSNTDIGSYVSRVGNLAASKIGPNTLLKVMSGDEITASTMYFYQNDVVNTNSGNTVLSNIISSLVNAISGSAATAPLIKTSSSDINASLSSSVPFSNITSPDGSSSLGSQPKAYLSVLFFDERFNFVEENSLSLRVSLSGNSNAMLAIPAVKAPRNGYVYVYVSNESDEPVYFDNLQVTQAHGRIIEEDHYYAYGLKITAISSRKLGDVNEGYLKNNNLYNDKEFFDDGDLNWYDYGFRNYDPQIGRFTQLDPLTDHYPCLTPYQYASNDPILNIDVDGLEGFNSVTTLANVTITASHSISGASKVASVTSKTITVAARVGITITAGVLANAPTSQAINMLRNSPNFKQTYQQFDIDGSFFGGFPAELLDINTNIVLDVFNEGLGLTKFEILDPDGNWVEIPKVKNPKIYSSNSKVKITIFVNPKRYAYSKVSIANAYNHELSIHATPFIKKTLSLLRNKGSEEFFNEWKNSSSLSSNDNASTIPLKYNGPNIPHAEMALGLNKDYNAVTSDFCDQLTPSEQKNLDNIILRNPTSYRDDIDIYQQVKLRK